MTRTIISAFFLLAVSASLSQASARNYFAPEIDGARLDACLAGAAHCGKPAADAFCQAQGFDEALIFQREILASTKRLGSDLVCEGGTCTGFRQIKCYSPST